MLNKYVLFILLYIHNIYFDNPYEIIILIITINFIILYNGQFSHS
jgi:hypothetical protein